MEGPDLDRSGITLPSGITLRTDPFCDFANALFTLVLINALDGISSGCLRRLLHKPKIWL